MAANNPLALPLKYSLNKHGLVAAKKDYSGGTNLSKTMVAYLLNSGDSELHGDRLLPATLDTGMSITAQAVLSSPAAGAGGQKIRLEFAYRALGSTESMDYSSWQEAVATSFDVSAWGAKTLRLVTWSLTAGNFAASDFLEYVLRRYPTHGDDNHEQDLRLHDLSLLLTY